MKKVGFKLNLYDPCVANLEVDGSQLTIVWYVDDLKISYTKSKTVDLIIEELEKIHGEVTVMRGNKHTYVGMDIEFTNDGKIKIY